MRKFVGLSSAVIASCATFAWAAEPPPCTAIHFEPASLEVTAFAGDSGFSRTVYLLAGEKSVENLAVVSHELTPGIALGRTVQLSVSLTTPATLKASSVLPVTLTLAALPLAGTYSGTVVAVAPKLVAPPGCTLQVKLTVVPKPAIELSPGLLKLQLSEGNATFEVKVTPSPQKASATVIGSAGDDKSQKLDPAFVSLHPVADAEKGGGAPSLPSLWQHFSLTLAETKPPPGRYQGVVVVSAQGVEDKTLPLELTYRHPWHWPAVVTLVGVLLAVLAGYMSTRGQARLQNLRALEDLRRRISEGRLLSLEAVEEATSELDEIERNEQAASAAATETGLASVKNALDKDQAQTAAWLAELQGLRKKLGLLEEGSAKVLVARIDALIVELRKGGFQRAQKQGEIDLLKANCDKALVPNRKESLTDESPPPPASPTPEESWLDKVLTPPRLKVAYWVLYWVSALLLAAAGLQALYVPNPIFGASPIVDYGALFLWSLASGAGSKPLTDLASSAGALLPKVPKPALSGG